MEEEQSEGEMLSSRSIIRNNISSSSATPPVAGVPVPVLVNQEEHLATIWSESVCLLYSFYMYILHPL